MKDSRELSPHAQRVTFTGEDLSRLVVGGPDQRVKLFVPRDGEPAPRVAPDAGTWRDAVAGIPAEQRPHPRTYTIRAHRPDAREVDIDFALRRPGGPASRWANEARPGDSLDMLGPIVRENGGFTFQDRPRDRQLLVGDQAALPAIGAILESLPPGARGDAVIAVPTDADRQRLAAPDGVNVTWLPGADGQAILNAVAETDVPRGGVYAWLAGETSTVSAVRRHLAERGVDRSSMTFMGYWRHGHSEEGRLQPKPAAERRQQRGVTAAAQGFAPVRSGADARAQRSTRTHVERPVDLRPDPELRFRPGFRGARKTHPALSLAVETTIKRMA
ncbi:siderophore-interacting protein [Yinghuangia sp. ASG 101]|uniref:siderophore-interacting protein n=1 Tax=Yinghuangia sp. ASG 101 TaxID=2896848 RepID=UPI001E550F67|nr:siderophore-interacting protein [Yinghuangia sp. ASG 101]UGQ09419.1 siderophore-interacting protein [Yinghuangia sp. ASG 101]